MTEQLQERSQKCFLLLLPGTTKINDRMITQPRNFVKNRFYETLPYEPWGFIAFVCTRAYMGNGCYWV